MDIEKITPDKAVFRLELAWIGLISFPPHYISELHVHHDSWEFMYIEDGEGSIQTDIATFRFAPGDLIAYPPGVSHVELIGEAKCTMKILQIIPPGDGDFMYFWPRDDVKYMKMPKNWLGETLSRIVNRMVDELSQTRTAYLLRVKALAVEFVSYLYMFMEEKIKAENAEFHHKHVTRTMEYIEEHYTQNIKLVDIAAETYVSVFYLSHIFKEKTGDTPIQFLLSLRMRKAQELLKNTDLTVTEISRMVGYDNIQYFSSLFRKKLGLSPREYRSKYHMK